MFSVNENYMPVLIDYRESYIDIPEDLVVIGNKAVLTEIPDKFSRVYVDGYTEVQRVHPKAGEFYVNYNNGIVTFGGTVPDNTIVHVNYKGKGQIMYPASRIYFHNEDYNLVDVSIQKVMEDMLQGNVLSVNGKKGNVWLTPADVEAVNRWGDRMIGGLTIDGTVFEDPTTVPLTIKGNADGGGINLVGAGINFDSKLAFYRGGTGFGIFRRFEPDYTIFQVSAPPTALGSNEATIALVTGDEPNVAVVDFYNQEYEGERQAGIRIQNRGTKTPKPFVIDFTPDGVNKTVAFKAYSDGYVEVKKVKGGMSLDGTLAVTNGSITVGGNTVQLVTDSISPSRITQDASNRFITDAERTAWNGKADKTITISAGSGLTGGGSLSANRTLAVNFSGSGVATTVARSDHNHDTVYLKQAGGTLTGDLVIADGFAIVPATAEGATLGTPEKPFRDVYVGANSLYVDGNKVVSSTATTLEVSTSVDQHLAIFTQGLGTTRLSSAKEVILYSGDDVNIQAVGDVTTLSGGRIEFKTNTTGQDINFETMSALGNINFKSLNQLSFSAPTIKFLNLPNVNGTNVQLVTDAISPSRITQDSSNRFMTDAERTKLAGISTLAKKVESSTTNGNIKIDGVETTVYTHPSSHPATMITEDTTHRFVTDTEKSTWNAKASTAVVTTSSNGLMISTDKSKLDGIATGSTKVAGSATNGNISINGTETVVYTHPSTHSPSVIVQDVNNRFVTDVEKVNWNDKYTKNEVDTKINAVTSNLDWRKSVATFADISTTYPTPEDGWTVNVDDTDITYRYTGSQWIAISANSIPLATSSIDGKMSSSDKAKLDAIQANAINQTTADGRYALRTISISAGSGLTGGGDLTVNRSLAVSFAGTGSATTVARSDHNHDSTYLKLVGGTLTGSLTISNGLIQSGELTTGNTQMVNTSTTSIYVGNPQTLLELESNANPVVRIGASAYSLWHTGNFDPTSKLDATAKAVDSDKLDGLDSTQFLRSDANGKTTGALQIDKVGRALTIGGSTLSAGTDIEFYMGNADQTGADDYGFRFLYTGSESGVSNSLEIWATNGVGGVQNKALRIQQDGILRLEKAGATIAGNAIWHAGNFNPATKLDLTGGTMTGQLKVTQGTNTPSIILEGATSGWASGMHFKNTTATNGRTYGFYSASNGQFVLSDETAGTARLIVEANGDIKATGALYEGGTALSSKYALRTTTVSAGSGLTGGGDLTANRSLAVNFAGTGSATTVSRSDHNHDSSYLKLSGGTVTGALNVEGASFLSLKAGATSDHVYMQFFADSQAQTTRSGYIGFGTAGTTQMTINNEMNGDIRLMTGGKLYFNTNEVWHAGNFDPSTITAGGSATADKWTYARTITLDGAVTGSVSIDGSANVTLNTSFSNGNNGIELGSTTIQTTPYLDFHSSGTGNDYDVRLLVRNGSASVGQGQLDVIAGLTTFSGSVRGNQSGALRIDSGNGWIDVGAKNTSYAHFETDRPAYYFNKTVVVNGMFGVYSGNDFNIQTNYTTRMTVKDSTGNVGIGTTSPTAKLDVAGDIKTSGKVDFGGGFSMKFNSTTNSLDIFVS